MVFSDMSLTNDPFKIFGLLARSEMQIASIRIWTQLGFSCLCVYVLVYVSVLVYACVHLCVCVCVHVCVCVQRIVSWCVDDNVWCDFWRRVDAIFSMCTRDFLLNFFLWWWACLFEWFCTCVLRLCKWFLRQSSCTCFCYHSDIFLYSTFVTVIKITN